MINNTCEFSALFVFFTFPFLTEHTHKLIRPIGLLDIPGPVIACQFPDLGVSSTSILIPQWGKAWMCTSPTHP